MIGMYVHVYEPGHVTVRTEGRRVHVRIQKDTTSILLYLSPEAARDLTHEIAKHLAGIRCAEVAEEQPEGLAAPTFNEGRPGGPSEEPEPVEEDITW